MLSPSDGEDQHLFNEGYRSSLSGFVQEASDICSFPFRDNVEPWLSAYESRA